MQQAHSWLQALEKHEQIVTGGPRQGSSSEHCLWNQQAGGTMASITGTAQENYDRYCQENTTQLLEASDFIYRE